MSARLRAGIGDHDDWAILCDYFGVDRAIELSIKTGEPAFLTGEHIYQEIQNYRIRVGGDRYSGRSMVDRQGGDVFEYIKPFYRGRSQQLSKVAGFCTSHEFYGLYDEEAILQGKIILAKWGDVVPMAVEAYVASRKVKNGAEAQIVEALSHIYNISCEGPVVVTIASGKISLEKYFSLLASKRQHSAPVVIGTYEDESRLPSRSWVASTPISKEELFEFLSHEFGISRSNVDGKYKTLIASKSSYFQSSKADSEYFNNYDASSLLSFLKNLPPEFDLEEYQGGVPNIPKVSAPIMFKEESERIGLDHTLASGIRPSHIAGAARALSNQAADLTVLSALENAVPRSSVILGRLAHVLNRVAVAKGDAEEADLIEFGVEFSAFETRVYDAEGRLGSLSKGEVLSFLGEGARFLGRFDVWKQYKEDAGEIIGLATPDTTAIAIKILRSALAEGVLTTEANDRVCVGLDAVGESDGPLKREGIARSAENFTAALGRGALTAAKSGAKDVGQNLKGRAVEQVGDASEKFIRKHAADIVTFAAARSGAWLSMMIKHFIDL